MKHTPEPWKHVSGPALNGTYQTGCTCDTMTFECHDGGEEIDEANAARIVVCINAMAGIEDPQAFVDDLRLVYDDNASRLSERSLNASDRVESALLHQPISWMPLPKATQ